MCLRHLFRSRAADVAVSAAVSRVLRHWPSGCKLLSNSLRLNAGSTNGCFQITCFRTGPSGLPRTHVSGLQTRPEDGFDTQLTDRRRRRYADVHDALKLSPHDSQTRHGLSLQRDRTGLLRRSVHARATIWAPFAVIQASSACSVNSATKFFGMSAFRLSTISSAVARFSSDAGASLFVSVMGSSSLGCARRATGLDAPSTLLLANVLIAYSAKGGLM